MKKKLIIRLQRVGRISRPFFLLVVSHKEKSAHGAYLARLGYYDPFSTKIKGFKNIVVFNNLLNYWISRGAIPNETVKKLLF